MNKACVKCGKIMLVPDIPLPRNYTQKCNACNHMNPVGEELYYEEHPEERPEDSIDLVDFDDRYVDPLDLSRGGIGKDNADEWMEKIKSHPLPSEDNTNPPVNLEEPFVAAEPKAEEPPPIPEPVSEPAPTPRREEPPPPEPKAQQHEDVVEEVRREFHQILDSLKQERTELLNAVEDKLDELALEIEAFRSRSPAPEPSQAPVAQAVQTPLPTPLVAEGEVLLCSQNSALIATCEKSLSAAGMQVNTATSLELARQRIQEFAYQTIVFDQKFVSASKENQAVLTAVRKIALPVRRHQSVVMITPGIPSCESQVFYQWGIDLNVHVDDAGDLGGYVRDLIKLKTTLLTPYLQSDLDTDRIVV